MVKADKLMYTSQTSKCMETSNTVPTWASRSWKTSIRLWDCKTIPISKAISVSSALISRRSPVTKGTRCRAWLPAICNHQLSQTCLMNTATACLPADTIILNSSALVASVIFRVAKTAMQMYHNRSDSPIFNRITQAQQELST